MSSSNGPGPQLVRDGAQPPAAPALTPGQVEYWNGVAGQRWAQHQASLDRALAAFGQAALERLAPRLGERILDVGCGAGETVLALAERVGPSGHIVGVDVSRPLLERARERAAALANVRFIEADAGAEPFGTAFDAIFSRFGVMFFAEPVAAFSHLRGALRAGGRIAFVCWQPLEQNAWCEVPYAAARAALVDPPPLATLREPGPFAFGERAYVEQVLSEAGFRHIDVQPSSAPVVLGETLDAAVEFSLRIGAAARLIAERSDAERALVRERITAAFAAYATADGVSLPGAVWVASARA